MWRDNSRPNSGAPVVVHDRHLPAQHMDKLRQSIQAGAGENPADASPSGGNPEAVEGEWPVAAFPHCRSSTPSRDDTRTAPRSAQQSDSSVRTARQSAVNDCWKIKFACQARIPRIQQARRVQSTQSSRLQIFSYVPAASSMAWPENRNSSNSCARRELRPSRSHHDAARWIAWIESSKLPAGRLRPAPRCRPLRCRPPMDPAI